MKRIGIAVLNESELPIKKLLSLGRIAEETGFNSIWLSESYFSRDAVVMAASLLCSTNRIKVGLGALNPYSRNPALIAMSAATLNELSDGRIIVALGSSARKWVEQMGMAYDMPFTKVKESVLSLKRMMSGESVSFEGETTRFSNVQLTPTTIARSLPIYVAAMGPKMFRMAGEVGDGVLLSAGGSPDYVKYAIREIEAGAKDVGRSVSDIDIAGYLAFFVSDRPEEDRERIRKYVAWLVSPEEMGHRIMIETSGFDYDMIKPIIASLKRGHTQEASSYVTDEMIDRLTIFGKPEECCRKLRQYIEAGLNLPIVLPMRSQFIESIEAIAPEIF